MNLAVVEDILSICVLLAVAVDREITMKVEIVGATTLVLVQEVLLWSA